MREHSPIQVVTATRRRSTALVDARFHVDVANGFVMIDGAPTAMLHDALAQAGATSTPYQVTNMLTEASFRRLLDLSELHACLVGRGRGAGCVRHAVELFQAGSAGTRSGAEDIMVSLILGARWRVPLVNVRGCTSIPGYEPDLAWPADGVVVEVDGPGHRKPGMRASDVAVGAALRADGWRLARVTPDQLRRDPAGVLAQVERCFRRSPRRRG